MNTNPNSISTAEDAAQTLATDLQSLEAELARHKDLYLRTAADFDNFRKRTAQENERRAAAQKESFIRELLPIIDNLERAIASYESSSDQMREGVQMTVQQLHQLLRRHGIVPEETDGEPFNPHFHEAVSVREDPFQPDQVILETIQRGYRRGNEVFRPAKVIVNDLKHAEATSHAG